MSASARTEASDNSASGSARVGQMDDSWNVPGWLLGRLSVLPALLLTAWLVAGLLLLLAGQFTSALMLVMWVLLAAVLVVFGLRFIPDRWQDTLPASRPGATRTPWWALAGVVAVALAFGVQQMIYHSEQIIVLRDPAAYIQFAAWIAHHGSLPIPQTRAAFGGTHHVLHFQSAGFYHVGRSIVPQFMAGLPMVLAAGFWIGGVGAAVLVAPLLGACAVLTFGGLAARLIGPRWAPLAALVLALSLPEQFTSRSSYSEPLAQILFLGGLCLVIDSLEAGRAGARVTAALGGLALGLTMLVRIDGASDILPVIPYGGLLLIGRRPQAIPLLGGLTAGVLCGGVDGFALSRPYLDSIRSSLIPLEVVAVIVVAATAVAVAVLWKRGLPRVRGRWLPAAAALLAVAVTIGFTIRPYFQTVRGSRSIVSGYQRLDHLPLDPRRLYSEISLHWVFWYIGVPAVILGTLGAALLARRCLRGQARAWTLPLMTFGWIIVTVLYQPGVVPDQPWASRRLVPAVLPGFILLAVWASAWLVDRLRQMGVDRIVRGGLVGCCAAALVLPTAAASFGLGLRDGGPRGIKTVADSLAFTTTYSGEIAAVHHMCAAIPRNSAVVIVDWWTGRHFTELIHTMCGNPVAWMRPAPRAVGEVVRGIERAGRRPVLMGSTASQLTPYGGVPREIMRLSTRQDAHTLTAPPRDTEPLAAAVWISEP